MLLIKPPSAQHCSMQIEIAYLLCSVCWPGFSTGLCVHLSTSHIDYQDLTVKLLLGCILCKADTDLSLPCSTFLMRHGVTRYLCVQDHAPAVPAISRYLTADGLSAAS